MSYNTKIEKLDLWKLCDAHSINTHLHTDTHEGSEISQKSGIMTVDSNDNKALLKIILPDLNVLNVRFCHPGILSPSLINIDYMPSIAIEWKFSKIVYGFCKIIWERIAVRCENSLILFTSQEIKIQFSFHQLEFYATIWHNEIYHKCQQQIKIFWHFSFCKITLLFLSGFKTHVRLQNLSPGIWILVLREEY